jgi:hypothetical protein
MKTKKSFIVFFAIFICMFTCSAFAQTITVTLNGSALPFDVAPQNIDGRVMVPMRAIFEALGADVEWNGETQTITAAADGRVIVMQLNNNIMTVNGSNIEMPVPPQLVNGRTLVPVRAVSEGMAANVEWNAAASTVVITTGETITTGEEIAPIAWLNQWLRTRTSRDTSRVVIFGYGTSFLNEIQHATRYAFEQEILPAFVFEYEDDLIEIINGGDINSLVLYLRDAWEFFAIHSVIRDLVLEEIVTELEDFTQFLPICEITGEADEEPVFEAYQINFARHFLDISIVETEAGNIAVLEMFEPGWTHLSTRIGIAYFDDYGLVVFTLERSQGEGLYFLSVVEVGERMNLGQIENNRQIFINEIVELVLELR